jgi:uncharacterized repeat protein (TIGR03803 family)
MNWISKISRAWASAMVALAAVLVAVVVGQSAAAQTFTVLHSFDSTDGGDVIAPLVQATNGNLYGTTREGGANGAGNVFEMTPSGTLNSIYSFCSLTGCADGEYPVAGLVQGKTGDFYGTTANGGNPGCSSDCGTVFKLTPGGTLTTLHTFCALSGCADGELPQAALIQATNGDLYGTTNFDGVNSGWGTLFKITPTGTLNTIYTFAYTPGGNMPVAALIQASNGDFYGTTPTGGGNGGCTYDCGTVFKITAAGAVTWLHNFCALSGCTDGGAPEAALVEASNGNFYGTTSLGGANGHGTVFEITPAGKLTTLYNFCSDTACADGSNPLASLVQATDGNLYGTTENGGNVFGGATGYCGASYGCGTIFKITTAGKLTTLYSFCLQGGCADGYFPQAGLIQDTNGIFYGTANGGVNNCAAQGGGCGVVFSLSVGLGPFVETFVPSGTATPAISGKEGTKIGILGQGFSSSSVVKFGGTQATAVTLSGTTYLTATVPPDALTAAVTVTTGATTLTSTKTFKVLPTIASFTPPSGPVGTPVVITGTGLSQTTLVKFGTVKATSVTLNSDTQVTAEVPTGATSATIHVTTSGGSATSKASFTVN